MADATDEMDVAVSIPLAVNIEFEIQEEVEVAVSIPLSVEIKAELS